MSDAPTRGQLDAVEQLREIERAGQGALEVQHVPSATTPEGFFFVELSVACGDVERLPGGLPLRDRERFLIAIPGDFPFVAPSVLTAHTRFAGFEHVQWGKSLCLYQSPETEWDASDGMFGFVARLAHWLAQGARNEFEPAGAPLHPPVAYSRQANGLVIPRADTPAVGSTPWIGYAAIKVISDSRVDIVGWHEAWEAGPSGHPDSGSTGNASSTHHPGAAVLLSECLPFEYPGKISDLIRQLAERGVSQRLLLLTLMLAALNNAEEAPLYVVIGTPARGIAGSPDRRQHLAVWKLGPLVTGALRTCVSQFNENERIRELGQQMEVALLNWAAVADLDWCVVREARPEVTVRRDHGTPASEFAGRAVSVWGAGALGGHVAEFLVRAGVRRLVIRDHGLVTPGILVRQPYVDSDIGRLKADVLAERLRTIDPRIEIVAYTDNVLEHPLGDDDWTDGADVVIDASASAPVLEKLELRRQVATGRCVPIVGMVVDHRAERGLVVVASDAHSGGPADVVRRAKLSVCSQPTLSAFADAFWPSKNRHPIFQPEPGCSANTFVGSAADLAGMAARMLNAAARDLHAHAGPGSTASATAHLLSPASADDGKATEAHFAWSPDVVSRDPETGFEIRIAPGAWREIQGWIAAGHRVLGSDVETGGVLFGEQNAASRVVWVDEVIGPPPDSWSAPEGFVCGTAGVDRANIEKRSRTRGSVSFVGMWHTHPESVPLPSNTDLAGMAYITAAAASTTPRALLLIIGYTAETEPVIGGYLFTRREFANTRFEHLVAPVLPPTSQRGARPHRLGRPKEQRIEAQITGKVVSYSRLCELRRAPAPHQPKRIALTLSGGGARAIAFHLGCLRALDDRGVLDQVRTLSTVSGGSVIGAMYAYGGHASFAAFDMAVVALLRRGLAGALVRQLITPLPLLSNVATAATAGMAALAVDIARQGVTIATAVPPFDKRKSPSAVQRMQPPFLRRSSRTTAFEQTLRDVLFGRRRLTDVKASNLEVIINATELRTGTAFRFGSRTSGSSRFGTVVSPDIDLAFAVAASAAYPALLPALDREFEFDRNGHLSRHRVLLTDGGVYDNLGTQCLAPDRDPGISTHAVRPDFIIACDAGVGVAEGTEVPYWWGTRMNAAFETLFRRVQNSSRNRLHLLAATGQLDGFILSYLGQSDERLPWAPTDLVPRSAVVGYPTDFSAMSDDDIELLTSRGDQLTRVLIAHYMSAV